MKNIPVILMLYAFICIPLMWFGSSILVDYGLYLTIADLSLWTISTIHIVKFYKYYSKIQKICYYGTLAYLMLERTDIVFKKQYENLQWYNYTYFSLYVLIFLVVLGKCIKDNLNEQTRT